MLSERSKLMYKIKYMPDDEHAHFKTLLSTLLKTGQKQTIKTVLLYIDKLAEYGFEMNSEFKPESLKKIEANLWELRPRNVRIMLTFNAKEQAFYLLNYFIKKSNVTPEEVKVKARHLISKIN
jgi:phage-related protein